MSLDAVALLRGRLVGMGYRAERDVLATTCGARFNAITITDSPAYVELSILGSQTDLPDWDY